MTITNNKLTINDIYKEFDMLLAGKTDDEKLEIINEYENNLIERFTENENNIRNSKGI